MEKGLCGAFAGLLLLAACSEVSTPGMAIANTPVPSLSGPASFDTFEVDQAQHLLYAADRTDSGIDVFDVSRPPGKYLQTISVSAAPNGLALAPDLGQVFVGLENGRLAIIDSKGAKVLQELPTGEKSVDLIDYAPALHRVFASSGVNGNIVSVDAAAGKVLAVFKIGFALEQPRFNPGDGLLYVASPDAAAVFQLDPGTGKIMRKLNVGGGCISKGMAINPQRGQALIACGNGVFRLNLRNPSDVEVFNQVTDGDIVTYDSKIDRFLVAVPSHKNASGEIGVFGGNPISYVTSVRVTTGGNSAAYDEASNVVYAADIGAGKAGLASFRLPSGDVPLSVPPSMLAELGIVVVVIILVIFEVGRMADPIRRPQPIPRRRRA